MDLRVIYLFCFFGISTCCSTGTLRSRSSDKLEERIINGNEAVNGQFPYQISLVIEGNVHRCGGGIIGERFVLTAAHCVTEDRKKFENHRFKVAVGMTELNDPKISLAIDVINIYVPKSYFQMFFKDDIAVLELKETISSRYGQNTWSKLDLPRSGENYAGQIATISGYGFNWIYPDQKLRGGSDNKLKYLNVNIIPNWRCIVEAGVTPGVYEWNICGQTVQPHRMYEIATGICNGDSGGPLVINNTVIGIASLGTKRCQENAAHSRYTRVSYYIRFIDNVMLGIRTIDMMVYSRTDNRDIIAFPED